MATTATLMTTEELLALPDDGTDRWLIDGELRERPMTTRNRFHCLAMTRTAKFLDNWRDEQPAPRGQVLSGDAGVRLRTEPDTTFGVDLVYVSAEVLAAQPANTTIIHGVPVLAVEILSPNDTVKEIDEKIDSFLAAGVAAVWVIDTRRKTVAVYRPGADPELVGGRQELAGGAELPSFRVAVAKLFE